MKRALKQVKVREMVAPTQEELRQELAQKRLCHSVVTDRIKLPS